MLIEISSFLCEVAGEAGRAILSLYDGETGTQWWKSDQSPLTAADLAANEIIESRLRAAYPDIPIVSEETAEGHSAAARRSPRIWLVDPLDGTKEFIKKSGEFTVNIALIENHQPVAGVVFAPAIGLMFFATAGGGAFMRRDGETRRIGVRVPAASPPRVAVSRDHLTAEDQQVLDALPDAVRMPSGSSLKFCLVASGQADLYARSGTTMEWDTAAAQCVAEEAGASVLSHTGQRIRYNKEDLRNPGIFCFADPALGALLGIQPQ